ncbi:MAG: DUF2341 domain-containing protein [Acidobacteria bacterium]|nr:DUF2341 domain-containing protein [Acidobacteriota bacterium]
MCGNKKLARRRLGSVLLFVTFFTTILSTNAAGSDAAAFSFWDSVKEFLGIGTAQVKSLQKEPSDPLSGWFDPAWASRRPITVSNTGSALTDYQVLITLDGAFDFSRANIDGSDVRAVSDSGAALPFWIESWNAAGNLARIWVKIPSIPNGNTTIYLYYGNPAASSASNGGNTFDFFDDDWASLSARWTINGGAPVVNSGVVAFASGATMQSRTFFSPGRALGFRGWFKHGGGSYKWGGFLNGVNTPYTYIGTVGDSGYPNVILTNNTTGTRRASDLGVLTGAFHIYEVSWTSTATRAFLDRASSSAGSLTQDIPTSSLPIQLGNYNDNRSTFDVDWVYLRNFRESEPTLAVGVEEGNQSADLELAVSDSPDPVMVGDPLTYSFTVTNHGPLVATAVVLSDNLPASVIFGSATASQGSCSGTASVTCDLGDIANNGMATVSVVVNPNAAGTIVNSAGVSSATTDHNTANNNASASTVANAPNTADLGITQTDSPDPVRVGNTLTYTLVVTNDGPATATGVNVNDILPSGVTYVSATSDHGTCSRPGAVSCDLGTLNNGASANITITVTPNSAGLFTNQASVSGIEPDPFTTNNSTSETTRVSAPSLGAIVLVNSNSPAYPDFQHFVQPYLDNFGVPYTVLDVATTAVETDVTDYALIIIGHRQIDAGNTCSGAPCLNSTEQTNIINAVNSGAGLINFDNDLSADGSTARYQFIQDIFNFGYAAPASGSGVLFTTAAGSHYITERHQSGESIGTGSMSLADVTLPGDATTLATTGGAPFLAVRNSGPGRAVQWGTYDWMSVSVKGPVYGLDDLVWRSMAWAARKPFIMQGLPPFLTMRVDDESGPFDWIHVANEVGIKPWAGVFLSNIDESEAADLSSLVNAGHATTSIHAFNGSWFYWNQTDTQIAANFVTGTQWHQRHNIPISKYVLPHYYQFGSNSFAGMADWGVQCVGTQMDPDQGYGAPWIMSGPYRKYETGGSSGGTPQYSADYMTIPGHPEFNGRFFNLVTEIRDDLGYEWYPNNDVPGTIGHGTLQTKRALDSMVLATLFTHDQSVSGITMENWRSILQGITANIAPYHPINVTMDEACQYIKSKHDSTIVGSSYDAATRRVTVNYSGVTQVPTKYYLFMDDHGAIRDMWVDVPQFSGTTQVLFTLPGELDHIVVTPATPSVVTGATQQFAAQGFDASNNPIQNLTVSWSIGNGGGTINSSGLFTAGPTPGTYNNTIVASVGSITGTASVTVVAPTLDHFNFQTIASPQYIGAPFQINITARDASNNLFTGYTGQANLSSSVGAVTPAVTGNFSNGSWTGPVSLDQAAGNVILTASAAGSNGISNSFAVLTAPTLDHFAIQTIASPQIVNVPFQVTITALDASNNPLPVYAGHPNLSASAGAITPVATGDFIGGSWTGTVSLSQIAANVTITVSDGTATATSNAFAVEAPPPYYQLTSPSYVQTTGVPFNVNVEAYQATINAWEDNHQDPVLTTTTDVNTLTYNAANGQWTEFLYEPSRPYPTILASVLHTTNLPTMRFYLNGIPNGRYQVVANLYDNARMRYFFGYTSANPSASYVDTLGNATGTQHREYILGTIEVTGNSFNLYVNNAQLLSGDYEMFGWAWIRLAPAEPAPPSDITLNLWEDTHQDPVLVTTTDVPTLISNSNNHLWTEFLYTTSRPFPSVMGSALHTPVTPTMHFYGGGIPNGQYQAYANLYDTNPLRYFYGYTSTDPNALYVDTTGAATGGTQHREYSLGTVAISNGSFDLYVNRADQLPGATYDIFGWAWIRLSPQFVPPSNLTLSSSSATMQFDANGNGVFGEAGDNVKALTNGSLSIPARDTAPGTGIIIAGTDFLGQTGSNTYMVRSPTATLTVTKDGSGSGTVTSDPAGIDCGATCTADFATSTVVTLAAAADISSVFTGWSGSDCSGTGTCVVTVDGAKSVTATFAINTYTITASVGSGGSISPNGAVQVDHGSNQTFTIVADPNYHVLDVLVDCLSVGPVTSYTFNNVTGNGHTIAATFAVDLRTISGSIHNSSNAPVSNVSVSITGGSPSTTTDASGNYSFADLPAGAGYTITPTLAGYVFDPISRSYSNLSGNVTTGNFIGYTGTAPRVIKAISQNVAPVAQVIVPVTMVSQGTEHGVAFSVAYDQNVLSYLSVVAGDDCAGCAVNAASGTPGQLGITAVMPADQVITAGTRQVIRITFNTTPTTPMFTGSAIAFGDAPTARQVTSADNDPLAATYANGFVTFTVGYEASVSNRPHGNDDGTITVSDYAETGLFVVGHDQPHPLYDELQRADSAPRGTRGDGRLTTADYVQSGRYSAGLDPVQPAGGAAFAGLFSPEEMTKRQDDLLSLLPRVLYADDAQTSPGQQVTVSVRIDANGDENGFGFTVSYDGTKLGNPLVLTGADLPVASPMSNTLTPGKVGVVTAAGIGETIPAGTREIARIRFDVLPTADLGTTPIAFTGQPVVNEVSDASAGTIPTTFTAGTVTILGPTAANASVGGIVMGSDGMAVSGAG